MQRNSEKHKDESPIFDEMTIWKIRRTKQNRLVILHIDGGVSTIIPFEGINNTSLSEEDYELMFKRIKTTLDELYDTNITIQFLMMRDNNVSDMDANQLASYLQPRAKYLQNLATNYQLFENRFYLSIHYANKSKKRNEGLLDKVKKIVLEKDTRGEDYSRNMEDLNNRVAELSRTYDAMIEMLSGVGAEFKVLDKEEDFFRIIRQFTAPSKFRLGDIHIDQEDPQASVRQQLFSGVRASNKRSDFVLDDYYHKIWTLDRAPREVIYGKSIETIENVPFEFIYSVSFRLMDQKESLNLFKFRLAEKRMSEGANESAIVEDRSLTAETKRISDNYDQFAYGDGRGVSVSCNFALRAQESYIEKVCRASHMSRTEVLRKFEQDLTKRVFARFGGSEWVNEENTQWILFNQMIPGFSNVNAGLLKEMFLTTENIPYFFAMYDNRRNLIHNGTNHFVDMRGNKVIFELMDPSLPAWNYSISGQTGSGKSVLMNAILTMQLADLAKTGKKPIICILDVGGDRGSYTKFMNLVQGTQINLSGAVKPRIQMMAIIPERSLPTPRKVKEISELLLKNNPEINDVDKIPTLVRAYYEEFIKEGGNNLNAYEREKLFETTFSLPYRKEYQDMLELKAGECEPSLRSFNLIMGVIEVILSSNIKTIDGFIQFEYDEIAMIVRETYRRTEGRFPRLSDLCKVAEEMSTGDDGKISPKGSKMLIKLRNWTQEGSYPMFDLDSNINMENDIILADLKGLENEPQLQVVYTLLLSEVFNNKMYFTKDRRKLMVRDEAWSLMKNARARDYFMEDLRTARKNGFATIAISQLPTDYLKPDPEVGRAIMSNMQVNIFCKFESNQICQEVGREYSLNPEIIEEMKGLGVVKEVQPDGSYKAAYSKFMMVMGKSVYILKNLLHPFEYILYSSSAEDNAIIDYYMKKTKQYESLEDVLWLIAQKKHVGDLGLADFLEVGGYMNKAREVRGGAKK